MPNYEFTSKSLKQLKKLDKKTQSSIIGKIEHYCKASDPLYYAETIKDFELGSYRFRVGDYRIIFDLEDDTIVIHKIGHRREIYK